MNRTLAAALCALLLGTLAPGCVSLARQKEGALLPIDRLKNVEIGKTTRDHILAGFGPPTETQRRDFEGLVSSVATRYRGEDVTVKLDPALLDEVFLYEYRRVNRFGLILGLFNYFSSVEKSDRLMFFFDPEGKVSAYGVTEGTKEL